MTLNKPGHVTGMTEAAQLVCSSPGDFWPNYWHQLTTRTGFNWPKAELKELAHLDGALSCFYEHLQLNKCNIL